MNDQEIVGTLQQQGVSPGEISTALNQAQVKNAVAGDPAQAPQTQQAPPQGGADQMQASVMDSQQAPPQGAPAQNMQAQYTPQTQEMQPPQQLGAQQEYYPQQEGFEDSGGGESSYGADSNTIIELAQQVFEDKIKKFQKKQDELNEIKTINQVKLDHIETRLKQIENIIDKLQLSVLDKVGSYGKDLNSIKKEMNLIENSVRKVHKKHASSKPETKTKKRKSKK